MLTLSSEHLYDGAGLPTPFLGLFQYDEIHRAVGLSEPLKITAQLTDCMWPS